MIAFRYTQENSLKIEKDSIYYMPLWSAIDKIRERLDWLLL